MNQGGHINPAQLDRMAADQAADTCRFVLPQRWAATLGDVWLDVQAPADPERVAAAVAERLGKGARS